MYIPSLPENSGNFQSGADAAREIVARAQALNKAALLAKMRAAGESDNLSALSALVIQEAVIRSRRASQDWPQYRLWKGVSDVFARGIITPLGFWFAPRTRSEERKAIDCSDDQQFVDAANAIARQYGVKERMQTTEATVMRYLERAAWSGDLGWEPLYLQLGERSSLGRAEIVGYRTNTLSEQRIARMVEAVMKNRIQRELAEMRAEASGPEFLRAFHAALQAAVEDEILDEFYQGEAEERYPEEDSENGYVYGRRACERGY